jgi:hypothetical protein
VEDSGEFCSLHRGPLPPTFANSTRTLLISPISRTQAARLAAVEAERSSGVEVDKEALEKRIGLRMFHS